MSAYATPEEAEDAFYDAFQRADIDAMMGVWAESDVIECVHPFGERLRGLRAVRESWLQIFRQRAAMHFSLGERSVTRDGLLSIHCVFEHLTVDAAGKRTESRTAATNVYQMTATGWRMILHHASPTPGARKSGRPAAPSVLH